MLQTGDTPQTRPYTSLNPGSGFTHVSPGLGPVPGPASSGPDLAVLVAGGASLHLHEPPREGGDLRGGHVSEAGGDQTSLLLKLFIITLKYFLYFNLTPMKLFKLISLTR